MKTKNINFLNYIKLQMIKLYQSYIKITIFEISLMAILLAFFIIIKYISYLLFKGPLNFNIEIIFWIILGILFGPIKGSLFSFLCDTIFTLFTTGIITWMIEYAFIAPAISLISWFFYTNYHQNKKSTIYFVLIMIFILISSSIIIFTFQTFDKFNFENAENFFPAFAYFLIIFLNFNTLVFVLFCLINFYKTKEWKYIKWLYIFSMIIFIIIVFRWLWGPYAFIAYTQRFLSSNINFSRQYWLTLSGIVSKSFLTIPFATIIALPIIHVIEKNSSRLLVLNKY